MAHSVANRRILETIARLIPEARIDYLAERYPDFQIDAAREQADLAWADIVVLQFPLFWYSAPSILHRWLEETFTHGFSHGREGNKLKGKKLVLSLTTGAPLSAYSARSAMGVELDDLLKCFEATCRLCQMTLAGTVRTGSVSYLCRIDPVKIEEQHRISEDHALRLAKLLNSL